MERVKVFLENVVQICYLLVNISYNQIKILIQTRVQYSKDLFNYEHYMSHSMHDERLVTSTLFCRSGK